jgi:DNA-binding transcriptional regulator WhiA
MSDLALLAGIVGSDGHLAKDEPQIIITNKNKEFIEKTVVPLIKKFTNKVPYMRFNKSGFGTGKYFIRVWSKNIWKKLQTKYNIPSGAKSKSIKPPENLSKKDKIDFLRGWIAGDGSITNERNRPKIEIWSKSNKMLEWFKNVLEKNEIENRLFYARKKSEYILRIGKQNSVKLFLSTISIPHPSKQEKLLTLCSLAFQQFSTS